MDLKFKRKNKTLIILVAGEIDHHSSKELRSKTESALEQMGGRNIIFGFQEVTFMDSAGIGVMIGRYKQVQSLGGRIAIACPNEKIEEMIQLSGLSRLLPTFVSLDAAIAYASASAVVGTSNEYAQRCMQDIPHRTVYVGVDIDRFDGGIQKYGATIEKREDEFWVAYAGSLAKSYDIETLIRACQYAAPIIRDELGLRLRLQILGDGPYRQRLENTAAQTPGLVTFNGYVDYQIMAAYLFESDILVNSLIKSAPQSIVSKIADYLCAGKPIINTGESVEFKDKCLRDGFGVNVEPENAIALAGAIVELAHDDELRMHMGMRGRAIAEEQFDRPIAYREIVNLVNDLLQ